MAAGAGLSGWAAITIWNAQTLLHVATVWLAVGAAAMAGSVRSLEWLQPKE